jgi:hypothetical protein
MNGVCGVCPADVARRLLTVVLYENIVSEAFLQRWERVPKPLDLCNNHSYIVAGPSNLDTHTRLLGGNTVTAK